MLCLKKKHIFYVLYVAHSSVWSHSEVMTMQASNGQSIVKKSRRWLATADTVYDETQVGEDRQNRCNYHYLSVNNLKPILHLFYGCMRLIMYFMISVYIASMRNVHPLP